MDKMIEKINQWASTRSLSHCRGEAIRLIQENGFPSTKNEDYKYLSFNENLPDSIIASLISIQREKSHFIGPEFKEAHHLYFENGQLIESLTQCPFLTKKDEVELFKISKDSFENLSLGLSDKVWSIDLPDNSTSSPIIIHHLVSGTESTFTPNLISINAGKNSKSTILEIFEGNDENNSLQIPITIINQDKNSHLEHLKVNLGDLNALQAGKLKVSLERDASLNSITFNMGGNKTRNSIEVHLNDQNATANVHGLFTTRAEQHCDNFSQIHHNVEKTYSSQIFKGILDDSSRGAFTGRVIVHRDAQEVNSDQLNKNLLLSKKAKIDTRPQLEVYADDVKCAHGATIGQISQEEVFYLESRGIPKAQAQKMLCHGFANEIIELVQDKVISNWLSNVLFDRFEKFALKDLDKKLKGK